METYKKQVVQETSLPLKGDGGAIIAKYFSLTDQQKQQFAALDALYHDWNSKINVISRKDIDNLYEHHVLHSLAIAELIRFKPGTSIMDLGTGGGFPGIPLAIMFPEVKFHLVDSIGKKIRVCEEVSKALELKNVTTQWCRAEEVRQQFHFVVSRAVMPLPDLVKIIRKSVSKEQFNAFPNGLICLKGGELEQEARPFGKSAQITSLSEYFEEAFFETKKLVYLPL
jgi:16S rRNA (guanine527-N7)-methyltransferase